MRRLFLHLSAAISTVLLVALCYLMRVEVHHRIPGTQVGIDAHLNFINLCVRNGSGLRVIDSIPTGLLITLTLIAPMWWAYRHTTEGSRKIHDRDDDGPDRSDNASAGPHGFAVIPLDKRDAPRTSKQQEPDANAPREQARSFSPNELR